MINNGRLNLDREPSKQVRRLRGVALACEVVDLLGKQSDVVAELSNLGLGSLLLGRENRGQI
jgi:hypothetical protein